MPKQLPSVRDDKGYQKEAEEFAKQAMENRINPVPLTKPIHLQEWLESIIKEAYLRGAQSAIRIGYRLAEEDYKETIAYYKRQNEQLEYQKWNNQ